MLAKLIGSKLRIATRLSHARWLETASTTRNSNLQDSATNLSWPVHTLDSQKVGAIQLPSDIFGVEVRRDILQRVVRWQLAKRRQGTHVTKGRSEVRGGGRKPRPQKGSGRARLGTIRVPQARGGGVVHGPVLRSHAHKLPKKVRRLGLKCALSAKTAEDRLIIVDDLGLPEAKTKFLEEKLLPIFLEKSQRPSLLLIDRKERIDVRRASANLHWVEVLPPEGLNVYSILRQGHLMISQDALQDIIAKLHTPIFRGPLDRARWAASQQQAGISGLPAEPKPEAEPAEVKAALSQSAKIEQRPDSN